MNHQQVFEQLMVVLYRQDVWVYNLFVDKQFHFDRVVEDKLIFQKRIFCRLFKENKRWLTYEFDAMMNNIKIKNNTTTNKLIDSLIDTL